jgi:trimeric autotransporter adhesin
MENASESILALKPVTFRYKKEIDAKGTPQFGLVAEEVAKVNPDLVLHDARGELSTVRYEAVNAMLPNEFLKEHRNVVEQQITLAERKTTIAEQQKQIDALTAGLQKVSAAVELNKLAATQVADNR